MDFESWLGRVMALLAQTRPDITREMLDSDALYQAFRHGVSPEGFASTPNLPLRMAVASPPVQAPPPLPVPSTAQNKNMTTAAMLGVFLVLASCAGGLYILSRGTPKVSDEIPSITPPAAKPVEQPKPLTAAEKKAIQVAAEKEARRKKEEARKAALAEIKQAKEEMKYFTGDGDVKVAVGNIRLKHSTESHYATGNGTFVYVFIAVKNEGTSTTHANPNDFTLADSDGNTSSHESDTYGLDNYFDAVNLSPGQQTSGWLIFLARKDKKYVLTRTGDFESPEIQKVLIP